MIACPACGTALPDLAKFCLECGRPLDPVPTPGSSSRRVVTILFSDIVGSTELGEQLDPETLRDVLGSYFAAMRTVVERHGGVVEKFIGDAVMAVFGLAAIHEDDALRAVRAAIGMREALAELNVEFHSRRGISIATRTGIDTGEVMAGDASLRQTMVTGDTANTAARLEQAAAPGEILLGRSTWAVVRQAVTVEPAPPVAAKGKAALVDAFRLINVGPISGQRGFRAPGLVGRAAELAELRSAFDTAATSERVLVRLVLGPAGVGKSRLVDELVAGLSGTARALHGVCLPYGDGITYWPIREILVSAARIDDRSTAAEGMRRLAELLAGATDRDTVVARLATAIGLGDLAFAQEEIFWAIRRTLEHLAGQGPLLVVLEDIHWAEPALLDLIVHLVEYAADVPLLLVLLARTEILERLPKATLDSSRWATIRLDGLDPGETVSLIEAIPGGAALPAELRTRILAAAEGNPLFLEEMVRMVVEAVGAAVAGPAGRPAADVTLPPTIHAVLAARVDQLPHDEREVAKRASIVGRTFESQAVAALGPAESSAALTESLLGLVRREVVAKAASGLDLREAYQFRHVLLRDAAYEALSKAERADLHRRLADWLESVAGERMREYDEILGYHLGRAYEYRVELRERDDQTQSIGGRASDHLAAAGRRAIERGEGSAAVRLLEQAARMPAGTGPGRADLILRLGRALQLAGRNAEATGRAEEALELALTTGDRRVAARARILRLEQARTSRAVGLFDPTVHAEAALALVDAEASGDSLALAEAHDAMGGTEFYEGDSAAYVHHLGQARTYAGAAGEPGYALSIGLNLLVGAWMAPGALGPKLAESRSLADQTAGYPVLHAEVLSLVGRMTAQLGDAASGEALVNNAIDVLVELGSLDEVPHLRMYLAMIRWGSGDTAGAEAVFHQAIDEARRYDNLFFVSFVSAHLGMLLVELGRYDEAAQALDEGELATNAITRSRMIGAWARIQAARGDATARITIGEALAMTSRWDWPMTRAEAVFNAAHVDASLGDRPAARRLAEEALALTRSVDDVPYTRRIEHFLGQLAGA